LASKVVAFILPHYLVFFEITFPNIRNAMDRFESMSAFVAVVEAGGFSAASRKLGMPLATVSCKVSELERQLSAQLLIRSTRKVELTDVGTQYFRTCRRLLKDLAEAERVAFGEYIVPKGGLTVTSISTCGSPTHSTSSI
jgi:DNA-binding transcriptional LysR family regulator